MKGPNCRVERPGLGTLQLRPIDLSGPDLHTLHDWVNRPYARFWGLGGHTRQEVATIFGEHGQVHGLAGTLGCDAASGQPWFLLENYAPAHSPLAPHYPVQPGDLGFHFMMAPAESPQPGLGYQLLAAALSGLYSLPGVQRLVAEPDLRNHKMITRMLQLGFQPLRVVHLHNKTAWLMTLERTRFEALQAQPKPPPRPTLRAWPLRVRWHLEHGRIVRKLRAWQGA